MAIWQWKFPACVR